MLLHQVETALNKARAQIALYIWVILLDPLAHEGAEAAAAHVGRVGYYAGEFPFQAFARLLCLAQLFGNVGAEQACSACFGEALGIAADGGKLGFGGIQQAANLVQACQGIY